MTKSERMPNKTVTKKKSLIAPTESAKSVDKTTVVSNKDQPSQTVTSRAPGRNKRSEETINRIMVAAEQLILESGVDRIAIQNMCEVAGISRGTFYRYFSSQEELLDAFSKHKRARFHLALHAATSTYLTPEERFNALISYLDNYLKHSKARRLLEVAPEFAFRFFNRIFHDSVERFQDVLDIVFDDWEHKLGARIDRELVCEILIRYVLSELLVPRQGDRRQLLSRISQMTDAIAGGQDPELTVQLAPRVARVLVPVVDSTLAAATENVVGDDIARQRRSGKTIDQILIATETAILESGVERVSILSICEVAGISRGTFYRYFSSYDELLAAYTKHKRELFHNALWSVTSPYSDPDERFAALVAHLDRFLKDSKARRFLLVAPKFAFEFFQQIFLDSLNRFEDALEIVFDAWDLRLGVRLDRELICEMLIRYVLSELLVLGQGEAQLPKRIARLIMGIRPTLGSSGSGLGSVSDKFEVQRQASIGSVLSVPRQAGRNSRSDLTIQDIITAAETVILTSGVERISILAVCEAARISRGTFYRYFSSQDALLDAFTEAKHTQFHQALVDAAEQITDPEQRFDAVMAHLEAFLRQDNVRRLLTVAPDYALAFFQRMFTEAIVRFKSILEPVFDAWDEELTNPMNRDLACELLVRYILSELLVPTPVGTPLLPTQFPGMLRSLSSHRGELSER